MNPDDTRARPADQALVQAPSPAVSALTGFDPSRFRDVYVVWLCDETGKDAKCQDVGVVDSLESFAAFAEHEFGNPQGTPERGYVLHDRDGNDLGFTLVTMRYPFWEQHAIATEARQGGDGEAAPFTTGDESHD